MNDEDANMYKRIIGILVIVMLIAVAGWYSYMKFNSKPSVQKTYPKAPLTVVIDWELTKPFELQIYYTIEQSERFSYIHSIKKQITPADTHVEIVIPEDKIYKFRIDFGRNPEQVLLKNVEIIADQYINFNDWYSYAYMNIEKNKVHKKDNTLTVYSTHDDPYMFWSLPFVLYKNE